jgi:hypothetical protein
MTSSWDRGTIERHERQTRCVKQMPGRARNRRLLNRNPNECRIERLVIGEDLVVLRISGGITGQDVDMPRGLLEQESGGFAIDLRNVLLVDREAVELLALSEANGIELRNCPAYIREGSRERGRRAECVGARDRRRDDEHGSTNRFRQSR